MKAIRPILLLLILVTALTACAFGLRPLIAQMAPAAPAPPPATRAVADKHYAEKSYALALLEYQAIVAALPAKSPDRALLQYRVAVALGESQKWDEAVAAWAAFLTAHSKEPLWTARAHYQHGLLLTKIPHQGYKVGTRIYRGTDYPHIAASEKPENVWLAQDDADGTLADFEQAAVDYDKVQLMLVQASISNAGDEPDPPLVSPLAGEKTDLSFDLARLLSQSQNPYWQGRYRGGGGMGWGSDSDWKAAKTTDWAIHTGKAYDSKWPQPKKILFLLDRIPTLNPADTHNVVLAALTKGLYVAQNHSAWVQTEYVVPPGHPERGHQQIVQTIPYFTLDPMAILNKAANAYPNDAQAPQIRLIVAQWTERAGAYTAALKLYNALIARYPGSKWTPDARYAGLSIQQPSVRVNSTGPQHADQSASISLNSRDLKTITLRAYQVPLDAVVSAPGKLEGPAHQMSNFADNFGTVSQAEKLAQTLGTKVAEWTEDTHDDGKFVYYSATKTTPLTKTGAYLVIADGNDGKTHSAGVVLITNLALMKKVDTDSVLCFVADARSGRPVPGASVIIRQLWTDNKGNPQVQVGRGTADADGMVSVPTVKAQSNLQTEAFAAAPGGRYALTSRGYWYGYNSTDTRDEVRIYSYTDRPVYRPGQTVSFREILARRAGGGSDYAPLTDTKVHVTVSAPRGGLAYDQTLTTSAFGTVSGSFVLPTGAALGQYSVQSNVLPEDSKVNTTGGSQFRVEEYKRPEYLVTVTPSTPQARFGDTVTAKVQATYYSGPPVAGAKVAYKIFRSSFYNYYRFPQPYDWYTNSNAGGYENSNAAQGELVTSGSGVTDAQGALAVSFTADKGTRGYRGDYAYTVMADVVDASRRLVSGEGVLHITNQAFSAYLNIPSSFYHQGDTVPIELRTQNADKQPVSASGQISVIRQVWAANKYVPETVHTEDVTTDTDGKALTTWKTDQSGSYQIEFKAKDKFEQDVTATAPVWISGDDLSAQPFHVGGITVLTDKTTYTEGETAHLLILCDQPDTWVLLTSEAGSKILTHTLVHVTGRAKTMDVPIVRADIPNFAFAAVAMRDYGYYQWQQQVFVPPVRQFLKIAVTGDKAEYKPGDTGTFHVTATDYLGRPAAAEVSLAVIDSSVFYIQKDYAPDIRLFYYDQRRATNVGLDTSNQVSWNGTSENPVLPSINVHGIHLPEVGRLPGEPDYPFAYSGPYGFAYDQSTGRLNNNTFNENRGGFGGSYGGGGFGGGGYPGPTNMLANPTSMDEGILGSVVEGGLRSRGATTKFLSEKDGGAFAPVSVRRNFSETAFWTPAVVTDKTTGTATLTVHFPDTLTTWKATARGLTTGDLVGGGDTQVITNKHLLVRLEAPRFFTERDRVTLSAIVRNDLATEKSVRVSLTTNKDVLTLDPLPGASAVGEGEELGKTAPAPAPNPTLPPPSLTGEGAGGRGTRTVTVPAHSETRVDWTAQVVGDGQATVKMAAETDEESDAVEQSFPALTYGVQKLLSTSGVMAADQNAATLTVTLPKERKAGSAALLVQLNPSLAATTLDALPYLADYPYGCVEQTLSRFVPSVVVADALRKAGVNLETLHTRAQALEAREQAGTPFGQAAPTTSATDQTGYTYPTGTPGVMKTAQLAGGLYHTPRWHNPVFDPAELQRMTDDGLSRLLSMQQSDGGWGWWGGSAYSDPYLTGYTVYGLSVARDAGVAVPPDVLARADAWLARDIKDRDDERDLAVWESFALSHNPSAFPASAKRVVQINYAGRDRLSAYGQALLALTLHNLGDSAKAETVCRNLRNTAQIDTENGTASWKPRDRYWWNWYNNDVETDAWALKAYVAILPKDDLTPMLVKWLVQNKRGSQWHSTKETAMAVYALTDYIKANNELAPDYKVTVALGDKVTRTYTVTRDNALLFDNQFVVPDALLTDGPQTVTLTKSGAGRLYYSTALQYFTTEENITASGTELKIQRRYYTLTPKTKQAADWNGGSKFNVLDYTRTALADGASLKSGDLIEVELILDSKNEYDYCVFEDLKPAGCEPVDLRSGERYGDGLCSNMELRDTKTAFFVDHLPQGTRVLRYRLRAEIPGTFHALPTNGYAMYAPEVRALSDGWHVTVGEAGP